jgi:hypothetical protein
VGEPVEFLLHEWDQPSQSALIPVPPSLEKLGYFDTRREGGIPHAGDSSIAA